ncbi:hypothetical protein NE237_026772 [Protea cynaroides]|uniref:Uncharacterized protein n=1 Tax=Protea cynaroides TaxID=273540 RepID=A0A9Q0GK57_9MAGN|nr:hypothetical protein NE237_026772 [Protea cynaroides]
MPMGAGFLEKARADSETWDLGLATNEGKLFELSPPAAYVVVSERVQLSLAVLQRGKAHGAVTESLSRLQRERRRYGVASAVDIEMAKERSLKLWTETTLRNKEA